MSPGGPRLHRVREVEALAQLAAEIAQTGELLVEFDALGYDLERERAAERHDGAGEIRRLAGGLGPQEGAVHLDDVDREAAEIAERGVAGAEVVHRDANTERAQRSEEHTSELQSLRHL